MGLTGISNSKSEIKPWSETRSDTPVDLPDDLESKNLRLLNPLTAPDFYYEFYDGAAETVVVKDPEADTETKYELVQNYSNEESSSHFKVVRNPETGHYIVMSKGMDMPGRDEGAGSLGTTEDLAQLRDAEVYGAITDQVIDAEKVYLELLQNPDVKSIEIIGYSIGSIPANYLASVYDAQVTNIADLGVPGTKWTSEAHEKFVKENFDLSANGMFPAAAGEFKQNLDENVIGLKLRLDGLGGMDAGEEFGKQITVDEKSIKLMGVAHVPQVYAESIAENFPDAPTVETEETTEFVWKPIPK